MKDDSFTAVFARSGLTLSAAAAECGISAKLHIGSAHALGAKNVLKLFDGSDARHQRCILRRKAREQWHRVAKPVSGKAIAFATANPDNP